MGPKSDRGLKKFLLPAIGHMRELMQELIQAMSPMWTPLRRDRHSRLVHFLESQDGCASFSA